MVKKPTMASKSQQTEVVPLPNDQKLDWKVRHPKFVLKWLLDQWDLRIYSVKLLGEDSTDLGIGNFSWLVHLPPQTYPAQKYPALLRAY